MRLCISGFPENGTPWREMDDFSHTEGTQSRLFPRENHLAHYVLNLKSVFIMKYGQFHTLHGAIKERVGSIRKLKTR
jgi:hypothetical protein